MARYKKNYLNGSLFGSFSSNPADKVNYLFNNIIDAHYDYLLANPEDDPTYIVLSGLRSGENNGSGPMENDAKFEMLNDNQHIKIKVRKVSKPIEPDPSPSFTTNVDEESFIIGMHEWAYSDKPIGDATTINAGMKVRCYYADGSPYGKKGKILFFRSLDVMEGLIDMFAKPFQAIGGAVANSFQNNQNVSFVGEPETPVVKGSQIYSLQGYREIARRLNNNVMKGIRDHESANKPTISNYGYTTYAREFPEFETYTVDQIRQIQQTGMLGGVNYMKPGTSKAPFAVGLYQIIPKTMDFIRGAVPEVRNLRFTRDTQNILGAILIMNKRPVMGNYLLGKHNNITEAGQNWAYEWAYAPSQYDTRRLIKEGPPEVYIGVPQGASYYTNSGGNRAGDTPQNIRAQLKAGRTAMQGFSDTTADAFPESDPSAIEPLGTSNTSDPYDPYGTSPSE
jgi:hypothetical protein